MNGRWILACALAEGIGMTAAAGAATIATSMADADVAPGWALGVVVLGGLAEGVALGVLQASSLPRGLSHGSPARRWAWATVLVAGLGWAAGSAPGVLANDDGGTEQGPWLVLGGAALLGAVMGAVLGGAQAGAVRRHVQHPWRWVIGSVLGWTAAMPVIYLGATVADHGSPLPAVLGLGAATGVVAGLALGAITAPFVAALDVRERPAQRLASA
jgi:hypothetical protein